MRVSRARAVFRLSASMVNVRYLVLKMPLLPLSALPEPQRTQAQIEWDYSNGLERGNAFVATLGAALGLNAAGIDALFVQAAQL